MKHAWSRRLPLTATERVFDPLGCHVFGFRQRRCSRATLSTACRIVTNVELYGGVLSTHHIDRPSKLDALDNAMLCLSQRYTLYAPHLPYLTTHLFTSSTLLLHLALFLLVLSLKRLLR